MTDQDLLRSFADRADVQSLDLFIQRYQTPLLRFATKFLGDRDAAFDVVQETFLQVAERPAKLFGVESCHNWLLRVARNIGIDHLRRKRTRREHQSRVAAHTAGVRTGADESDRPTAAIERSEIRREVRAEIDRLKPRYRELLLLKVVEEKSYKEIAEITGLTATNVGYLLHKAMKILTERLQRRREDLE